MTAAGPDQLVGGPPEPDRRCAPTRQRPAWWRVAAAVALALAAAGVVLPRLSLSADRPAPQPSPAPRLADPRPDQSRPDQSRPLLATVAGWPMRGSLSDGEPYVAAALAEIGRRYPGVRRPIYASHLPDGSVVVIASTDPRPARFTTVAALQVPLGRAPSTGTVSEVTLLGQAQPSLAWATAGKGGETFLVAIGAPVEPGRPRSTAGIEVSPRVDIDATGTPSRRWQRAAASDGVVVAELGSGGDPQVALRSGSGAGATTSLVAVTGRPVTPAQDVTVAGLDAPGYRGPRPALVAAELVDLTAPLLDVGRARPRVIWSAVPWRDRRMALVLLRTPDGRRWQALVGEQDDRGYAAGLRVLPDGAPATLPWLLEPASSADPTQLLCPGGGAVLDYLRPGRDVRRLPVRADGVVNLLEPGSSPPSSAGATVVVRDAAGRPLVTTRLPERGFDDALALDG